MREPRCKQLSCLVGNTMATWHQQKAGLQGLYVPHETKWKFVSNPPNDCAAVGLYDTKEQAEAYVAGLRKHQGENYVRHCTIVPPNARQP